MTLVKRGVKGSALTHAEVDGNWDHVLDSANTVYTPSGTGAVDRTVADVLKDRPISVKDFGAVGDGATPSRAAIQAALNAAKSVFIPSGNYLLDTTVLSVPSDRKIYGEPGTVLIAPEGLQIIFNIVGGDPSNFTALTANALRGARQIEVTSVDNIVEGSWVFIRSQALLPGPNTQGSKVGEWNFVTSISSLTLNLRYSLLYDYNAADTAEAGPADVKSNVHISDIKFVVADGADQSIAAVRANNANNIVLDRLHAVGKFAATTHFGISHFRFGGLGCVNVRVNNCISDDAGHYGVSVSGACRDIHIDQLTAYGGRHATSIVWGSSSSYGEPVNIKHTRCVSYSARLSAFDTHESGRDIDFEACVAMDAGAVEPGSGFQVRNNNTTIRGCLTENSTLRGIDISSGLEGITVSDTIIRKPGSSQSGISAGSAVLTNVKIEDASTGFAVAQGAMLNCSARRCSTVIRARRNGTEQKALSVINLDAPFASGQQTTLVNRLTDTEAVTSLITFIGGDISGYGNNLSRWGTSVILEKGANFLDARTHPSAAMFGTATLTAGEVTVSTAAVRNAAASGTTSGPSAYRSLIEIAPIGDGTDAGALYVEQITDATSFVVKSTNASDARAFVWRLRGIV
jgi:hypothetical protein